MGPVETRPFPQKTLPTSRMSCRTLTAEASDTAKVPEEAPAEVPGEATAETLKASETAEVTGGVPVGTPEATFQMESLGAVKEILGRHNSREKVKRIEARWLWAQICIDREAIEVS